MLKFEPSGIEFIVGERVEHERIVGVGAVADADQPGFGFRGSGFG
jgi:hypothetical protein